MKVFISVLQRRAEAPEAQDIPFAAPQQAADVFVDATSSPPYSTASDTSQVPTLCRESRPKELLLLTLVQS